MFSAFTVPLILIIAFCASVLVLHYRLARLLARVEERRHMLDEVEPGAADGLEISAQMFNENVRLYNKAARRYNTELQKWPASAVAGLFLLQPAELITPEGAADDDGV